MLRFIKQNLATWSPHLRRDRLSRDSAQNAARQVRLFSPSSEVTRSVQLTRCQLPVWKDRNKEMCLDAIPGDTPIAFAGELSLPCVNLDFSSNSTFLPVVMPIEPSLR
jgi:hypothetical protein